MAETKKQEETNPQDNIGCLGWLLSLLFDPLPEKPKEEPKKEQAEKEPKNEQPKEEPTSEPENVIASDPEQADTRKDYSQSYQAKYLLTKNEWYEYRRLRDLVEPKGLRVCPKVRLLDMVEPRRGEGYMSMLGKIQSKHVDFVITDRDMHIKAILELDDKSHDKPDRQERDQFVDEVLTSVGYKVIRTRSITKEVLKDIIL